MVLIAYHMIGSSIGAYLEWIANQLKITAKPRIQGCTISNASCKCNKPASQISLAYYWSLLFFFCRVSLAEYNRVLRVSFPLLQVTGADSYVWKPSGGLRKDSFHATNRSVYL